MFQNLIQLIHYKTKFFASFSVISNPMTIALEITENDAKNFVL